MQSHIAILSSVHLLSQLIIERIFASIHQSFFKKKMGIYFSPEDEDTHSLLLF